MIFHDSKNASKIRVQDKTVKRSSLPNLLILLSVCGEAPLFGSAETAVKHQSLKTIFLASLDKTGL